LSQIHVATAQFPQFSPVGSERRKDLDSDVFAVTIVVRFPEGHTRMQPNQIDSFPPEVIEKLGFYVYRLIDPRTGETFYVGKGKNNRVFQHARAAGKIEGNGSEDDDITNKLKQIREILQAGLDVGHVIHRHGMDEATAFQVEAALMDAYPGIHNIASGADSGDYGSMHATEIINKYRAEPAEFRHKSILINVARGLAKGYDLYDATCFAWKIGVKKAQLAEVILPVAKGIIKGACVNAKWRPATSENFPGKPNEPDRMAFDGDEAPEEIRRLYVGKRIPESYQQQGAANPIRYTWGKNQAVMKGA
jgi:hypothetical protein